jgi:FKBP-type peptidyl-prolyl cis-trans isomerase
MPRLFLILIGCLALALPALATTPALETEDDKILYALGLALSRNLQAMELSEKEAAFVLSGLSDGVLGNEPKVDLRTYGPKIDPMLRARVEAMAERTESAGTAFRAEAAKEDGAVTTESGLIYLEQQPGQGASPSVSDTVKVHYHGTLPDGTVFDSSRDRGEPTDFPLNGVIPCFSEGIQKMKVGGKSKLTCAPELAYGERGSPPTIGPRATLVFEVELLEIVTASAPTPAPELP